MVHEFEFGLKVVFIYLGKFDFNLFSDVKEDPVETFSCESSGFVMMVVVAAAGTAVL